jgi:glycine/D-amino acid oxidase-like deaminating enzyme
MNGGKVLHHKVESLQDLCGQQYDAVINCSGVHARSLAGDDSVQPVRGQVTRVSLSFEILAYTTNTIKRNTEALYTITRKLVWK